MGRGARRVATFLLAVAGASPVARAVDAPRWPLDLPPVLTSSFGEYRANHIHAGMDFGTGGRTGALCRAVGDGSVVRMRMSPYGYGKALYIQQDGGPLVVYAHLSRFAEPMAARARAEQKKLGRDTFDIQIPPGEMRVLRGSVIAWSGDTGVGVPHLHFEMRDGDVARNPQTAGFAVPDTIAPVIGGVYATPMDVGSHVAGGLDTRELPRSGPPLLIGGTIGFSVKAWDHAASREHRQGPYRYEVRIDGKVLFKLVQERFDYADNHLLNVEYDQERLVEKGERVQLLYLLNGNRLPGREAAGSNGCLQLRAEPPFGGFGERTVEIVVADVAGHETVRRGRILIDVPPGIDLEANAEARRVRWKCRVTSENVASIDQVAVELAKSRDRGASWDSVAKGAAVREADALVWQGEQAWDGASPLVLRARARSRTSLETVQTWSTEPSAEPTLVEVDWKPYWMEVELRSASGIPSMPAEIKDEALGQTVFAFRQRGADAYRISVMYSAVGLSKKAPESRSVWEDQLNAEKVRMIGAATEAYVADLDPGLVVDIPAGALLQAIALRAERRNPTSLGLGTELRAAGPCLRVEPRTAALDKPVRVGLKPAGVDTTHVGLFWVNRGGDLRFLSRDRDSSGAFASDVRFLTDFALLCDTTPPRIGPLTMTPQGKKRPQRLRFIVRDDGARMGDGGVSARLDGALAIPEWDSETGAVVIEPDARLVAGKHVLRVVATDQLGNRAERSFPFTVP